jgi:hypothetical protein
MITGDFENRKTHLKMCIVEMKLKINTNFSSMNPKNINELIDKRLVYKYELANLLKREKLHKKLKKIKNG